MPADRRRFEAGFTLIEVLAVLTILALAIGILAGRGPPRSATLEARGAAQQVARTLRLARSQAIAGNHEVSFTLDVARRGYQVGTGPWTTLPASVDITVIAIAGAPSAARIVFAPDGGSTGGRIRLAGGAAAPVIAVDWLSGRVTVGNGA